MDGGSRPWARVYVPSNSPKWTCYKCRNKIPVVDLDGLFRDELKAFMVAPEKVEGFLRTAKGGLSGKQELVASLRKERDHVKHEADQCFVLFGQGSITSAQFKDKFQPLDARKHEIDREIPRIQGEIDALTAEELSCEHVMSQGTAFYDRWPTLTEEQKRGIVELFLKGIEIGKDDVAIQLVSLPVFEIVADGQRGPTDSSQQPA